MSTHFTRICAVIALSTVPGVALLNAQGPCLATDVLTAGYPTAPTTQAGIMFDLQAAQPIELECLEVYFQTGGLPTTTCEVWFRAGSHVGAQTIPSLWTLLGRADNLPVAAVQSTPVYVPIDLNVSLMAGQTVALYVTNTDSTFTFPRVVYAVGNTTGVLQSTDGTLSIYEGSGIINYFGSVVASPRKFQGNIWYSTTSTGMENALKDRAFDMHPNPANDLVSIDLGGLTGTYSLYFRDSAGRTVFARSLSGGISHSLDVSELDPGVYLVHVDGGSEQRTMRFVIQ